MGLLKMACMGFLAISARAQPRQNCSVVVSPFTVSSTEDASTLATSLGCSIGDVDVQWVGEVFVVETIHVTDGTSLSITGAGSSAAIADGRNSTQLFVVDRSSRLHLSDMTLAHGNASFGGAINALEASVSFSGNVSFISNSAGVGGGAIFANRSRIFWDGDGTQFIFNVAGDDGGAIYAQGASNVSWSGDGTQFISNSADGDDGGAIWAAYSSTVSWEGDDTEFRNNSADDDGGAIFAWESTVSWSGDGTQFIANSAAIDGGAIGAYLGSNVSWDGDATVFSNNSAGDDGGAIYTWESTVSWEGDGTQFYSNFVDFVNSSGGAIYASGSTVFWGGDGTDFISNSAGDRGGAVSATYDSTVSWVGNGTEFSSNFAGADGGAIYVTESTLSCASNGTQIRSNFANFSGGAIYATESSTVSWRGDGTQFISNSANASGGAIYVDESLMSWFGDGTDFSSNSAGREDSGGGGALYVAESPTMIWHGHGARFLSNSATVGSIFANGGAIYLFDSTVSWNGDDTELSSNSAHEGGAIYAYRSTVYWHGNVTRLDSNSADEGGAIYASYTYVDWDGEGTQFYANSAGIWDHGGAMYVYYSTVYWNGDGTEFSSNFAADGGAIYVTDASDEDLPAATFSRCTFSDNMGETGGAVGTLAAHVQFTSCFFEGNTADVGGALRLDGGTVVSGCSFLSNSAVNRGLAVAVEGSTNISTSTFEGNELFCAAGSYRKYTEKERPTARYEEVCLDCPDWDQCSDCSIANGDVTATCQVPLENTQAKENGVTLETLDVTGGYWRATNDSVYILACYNADACIGGQTGAEDYCAPGYTGPYCAVCEPDYSPSLSFTCTRCSRSRSQGLMAATVIAALVIACVVVAIVRYLVSTQLGEERSTGYFRRKVLPAIPLQALKIIVVVWQILIQFADAAQATYPGVYQDFLSAIDIVDFDLGSVLSAGCLWSNMDFHDRVLVNTLGPLVVVGLLGITYRIAIYRSSSAGGDAVVEKIRYRHQTVLLLVTFLIYSSVSSTVFQTFACEKLDDGAEYLRADYSIQCTDAKHKNFEIYAGIMIFVYPVGIPLLYAILLFQRRDVLANGDADKTKAQSIAGLWEPYRPERFYYEVVECGRRIMLTGVVVFIFPNDAAQLAITMLLAFFFFMVFEMLRPYEAESDMWLSRGGHMTVFLSMFYLLLLKVDVSGERSESQAIYGGLLVACHVVMVLAIVVEVVGICYASRGKKHVVEETASSSESLPKSGARAGSDGAP
ncbi:unnamed protein product [Scytosiphon promiscuus]